MTYLKYYIIFSILIVCSCVGQTAEKDSQLIKTGAEQINKYIPLLRNKRVAIVANHTTNINGKHLVDSLLSLDVDIKKIFSPEHGFRGKADAGEHVKNYKDPRTGLPVISLYGSSKKPKLEDLEDIDILIFDLQDVGVRFYTYTSTMHYVMEACAEMNVEMLILDRPNPNGFYVDGPILDTTYRSFVGMHPIPIVHGMTIAEYAQMINGESWLENDVKCKLDIIKCKNYTHDSKYELPINPSPNLQNMTSIYLYPSLGFFEGTSLSAGRGTEFPFQVFGGPDFKVTDFTFTPKSINGASKYPKHQNKKCYGVDLRETDLNMLNSQKQINLEWIISAYNSVENKDEFFKKFFYNISGTKELKEQIIEGKTEKEIRKSWNSDLKKFKKTRKKYLLYNDFK
ncbi:MAG: DUF1343 domain-containing protein [Bacteroidales bacterium]|nr:DUF1343 domain-containing protein [Bacteroidales bacterium]